MFTLLHPSWGLTPGRPCPQTLPGEWPCSSLQPPQLCVQAGFSKNLSVAVRRAIWAVCQALRAIKKQIKGQSAMHARAI